jgi:hypothetical protein
MNNVFINRKKFSLIMCAVNLVSALSKFRKDLFVILNVECLHISRKQAMKSEMFIRKKKFLETQLKGVTLIRTLRSLKTL